MNSSRLAFFRKRLRIGLTRTLNFALIAPIHQQLLKLDAADDVETPDLTSAQLLQCRQNRPDWY